MLSDEFEARGLLDWLGVFQCELRQDMRVIDGTRKPGFYTIQEPTLVPDVCGDYMAFDADGHAYPLTHVLAELKTTDPDTVLGLAHDCEAGLVLDCPQGAHWEHMCECDLPELEELASNDELQAELLSSVIIDDEETFGEWLDRHSRDYNVTPVTQQWKTSEHYFFLTRKAAQRAIDHYHHREARTYANYIWHNPDLERLVTLIACLDLDACELVFAGSLNEVIGSRTYPRERVR